MNFACQWFALLGKRGFKPEVIQNRRRGCRIEGKPGTHGRARGVVNLIDQTRREFDELMGFLLAMRAGLDIEISENAKQSGADVNALSTGEVHQTVKA